MARVTPQLTLSAGAGGFPAKEKVIVDDSTTYSVLRTHLACPRCGYLAIPLYEDERPRCPSCGAVWDPHELHPPDWLGQWPPLKRSGIANQFFAAVRSGHE